MVQVFFPPVKSIFQFGVIFLVVHGPQNRRCTNGCYEYESSLSESSECGKFRSRRSIYQVVQEEQPESITDSNATTRHNSFLHNLNVAKRKLLMQLLLRKIRGSLQERSEGRKNPGLRKEPSLGLFWHGLVERAHGHDPAAIDVSLKPPEDVAFSSPPHYVRSNHFPESALIDPIEERKTPPKPVSLVNDLFKDSHKNQPNPVEQRTTFPPPVSYRASTEDDETLRTEPADSIKDEDSGDEEGGVGDAAKEQGALTSPRTSSALVGDSIQDKAFADNEEPTTLAISTDASKAPTTTSLNTVENDSPLQGNSFQTGLQPTTEVQHPDSPLEDDDTTDNSPETSTLRAETSGNSKKSLENYSASDETSRQSINDDENSMNEVERSASEAEGLGDEEYRLDEPETPTSWSDLESARSLVQKAPGDTEQGEGSVSPEAQEDEDENGLDDSPENVPRRRMSLQPSEPSSEEFTEEISDGDVEDDEGEERETEDVTAPHDIYQLSTFPSAFTSPMMSTERSFTPSYSLSSYFSPLWNQSQVPGHSSLTQHSAPGSMSDAISQTWNSVAIPAHAPTVSSTQEFLSGNQTNPPGRPRTTYKYHLPNLEPTVLFSITAKAVHQKFTKPEKQKTSILKTSPPSLHPMPHFIQLMASPTSPSITTFRTPKYQLLPQFPLAPISVKTSHKSQQLPRNASVIIHYQINSGSSYQAKRTLNKGTLQPPTSLFCDGFCPNVDPACADEFVAWKPVTFFDEDHAVLESPKFWNSETKERLFFREAKEGFLGTELRDAFSNIGMHDRRDSFFLNLDTFSSIRDEGGACTDDAALDLDGSPRKVSGDFFKSSHESYLRDVSTSDFIDLEDTALLSPSYLEEETLMDRLWGKGLGDDLLHNNDQQLKNDIRKLLSRAEREEEESSPSEFKCFNSHVGYVYPDPNNFFPTKPTPQKRKNLVNPSKTKMSNSQERDGGAETNNQAETFKHETTNHCPFRMPD
ncbi:unnamed protein product [Cyprideis torosa]|uniref:Uncharacterized protein n=1 Tax=Cyprideis torosa TaxID=163714 RepID=A0A7R8WAV4_9CRUS|nr:unnamed protein product [Cyprideis torosa]CAG0885693.1 unnamed protein product [Cyprideis torosa]